MVRRVSGVFYDLVGVGDAAPQVSPYTWTSNGRRQSSAGARQLIAVSMMLTTEWLAYSEAEGHRCTFSPDRPAIPAAQLAHTMPRQKPA